MNEGQERREARNGAELGIHFSMSDNRKDDLQIADPIVIETERFVLPSMVC